MSRKSGHVFERRLLAKHLESTSSCPVTGEPMTLDDVIEVQTPKHAAPRPMSATSVSGTIGVLQREWDALLLGTSELKRSLHRTRSQLSQLLYQYDGACRVIARLKRERDEAQAKLRDAQRAAATSVVGGAVPAAAAAAAAAAGTSSSSSSSSSSAAAAGAEEEKSAEASACITAMAAASEALHAARVKHKVPKTVADPETVRAAIAAKPTTVQSLHRADRPRITSMALHPTRPDLVLTGGADRTAILFDRAASAIAATLEGHSKPVTSVAFLPADPDRVVLTTAAETAKPVCVWTPSLGAAEAVEGAGIPSAFEAAHWAPHGAASVVSLSAHPKLPLVLTAGADGRWVVSDLDASGGPAAAFAHMAAPGAPAALSVARFHVDGIMLGSARNDSGVVTLWDVRQSKPALTVDVGCAGIASMDFSENGYHMAAGSTDGGIILADLRGKSEPKRIEAGGVAGTAVTSVTFDRAGRYLAGCASAVRVVAVKKWLDLGDVQGPGEGAAGAAFGPDAAFTVSACDKFVRWH